MGCEWYEMKNARWNCYVVEIGLICLYLDHEVAD